MKRTTRNAQLSRQEIIEKSAPVFNKHGYAGTSMAMLMEATGFQKGGIYRHFDTKYDLAREAFIYNFNQLREVYMEGVYEETNPKDQFTRFLNNYYDFLRKPTLKAGCPVLNTVVEVDDTDDDFRRFVMKYYREVVTELASIISRGMEQGYFKKDLNPIYEVEFIFATVEGSIVLGKLSHSTSTILEIFNRLRGYIEHRIYK